MRQVREFARMYDAGMAMKFSTDISLLVITAGVVLCRIGIKVFQGTLDILPNIMDDHESMDKAVWTREMLHIFCAIYIKAIDMGMRPNTHFDRCG
uniref:Uncharacterized protein n=1 Tax=Salix viminalis TaxID=40686 RepID=A0A6N2MGH6_SALVM